MKNVTINGSDILCLEDIHEKLADELGFPEYYGMNLDALHDCLGDVCEETGITIMDSDVLEERLGEDFERFMRVLNDTALENDYLYIIEV